MRFASRSEFGGGESAYGEALRLARARGCLIDLTVSNPTRCGFKYPVERLLAALNDPAVLRYEADALGMVSARQVLSDFYHDVYRANVPAERLLLTASTSEAYSYLLRLFCEPGDAILVPSPSYPLFDLLARLNDVDVVTYPLVYHDGWQIDPVSLGAAITPRTRAICVIHPNNPTGHFCSPGDRDALHAVARQYGLPLIVDEVFLDYAIEVGISYSFTGMWGRESHATYARISSPQDAEPPLTFVLGGLSKLLGLPQMKLAWMAVGGPAGLVDETMARLEVIADTFLSVATTPQVALPAWLRERDAIQRQIAARVRENLRVLDDAITGTGISRLKVEGGWSAVLRIPASERDTDVALHLLQEAGVAVHPGSFYGFPEKGWLVVSLLPQGSTFAEGVQRLARIEFGTPFPHVHGAL